MRQRGGTLYSKRELVNLDDFSQEQSNDLCAALEIAKADRRSLPHLECSDSFDCFGPMCQELKFERTFSGDMQSSQTASTRASACLSDKDYMAWDELLDENECKPTQTFVSLIVGTAKSGKRTLC